MISGTVKWYAADRGYGFLTPDTRVNGGGDVFVHVSAVEKAGYDDLPKAAKIGFELEESKRTGKICAVDLKLL